MKEFLHKQKVGGSTLECLNIYEKVFECRNKFKQSNLILPDFN